MTLSGSFFGYTMFDQDGPQIRTVWGDHLSNPTEHQTSVVSPCFTYQICMVTTSHRDPGRYLDRLWPASQCHWDAGNWGNKQPLGSWFLWPDPSNQWIMLSSPDASNIPPPETASYIPMISQWIGQVCRFFTDGTSGLVGFKFWTSMSDVFEPDLHYITYGGFS